MKPTHYKAPSAERLKKDFGLTDEQAATVRGLIRGEIKTKDPERFPRSNTWFRSCYHEPSRVDRILACLDEVCETHGVESLQGRDPYQPSACYLNTGDTYNATILYNYETDSFSLTTWGDFVERNGARYGIQ